MKNYKLLLFSDLHGNIYALKEFIKIIKNLDYDAAIFLGDIWGYYYYPLESYKLMKRYIKNLYILMGNHDRYFLNAINDLNFAQALVKKYGSGYKFYMQNLDLEIIQEFEKTLPYIYFDKFKLLAMHGSIEDYFEGRIYPNTHIKSESIRNIKCNFKDVKYVVCGHTHYPMLKSQDSIVFLNPGSIGQPRDYFLASFAILDCGSGCVTFRRLEYDRNSLIKDLRMHAEKNNYLFDIIKVKRDKNAQKEHTHNRRWRRYRSKYY